METLTQEAATDKLLIVIGAHGDAPERVWTLCLDYNALAQIETTTKRDLKQVDGWKNIHSGTELSMIVWCCLTRYSPDVTLGDVTKSLSPEIQRPIPDALFDLTFPGLVEALETASKRTGHEERLDSPAETWVDLWSVARYDLGLSGEEFGKLTPRMFAALCKRRNLKMKHERFANALTASAVYNVNRGSADQPMVTAYDFVRDAKDGEAREQTQILKRQIKDAVGRLPADATRARCLKVRESIIAGMVALGRTDAEELWAECWPDLI